MDIKDVMKLIDAGFTKDEIMQMVNTATKPAEETTPETEPAEETKPVEETKTEPKQEVSTSNKKLDDIISGLQTLNTTLQKSALQKDRQPEAESLDSILANIINPTFTNEKGEN